MAVSRAMRRLLRIREIEEEQQRAALESALGDLKRLEGAFEATSGRDRGGRKLIAASACTGEVLDRLAGLEETRAARRCAVVLASRIADTKVAVIEKRQEFLAKRTERRQAETLIQETEAKDAMEAARRAQQNLDDWFLGRTRRSPNGRET